MPPHRARAAAAAAASAPHSSPEFQRAAWDALRKSLNGLVNKVNASNMAHVLQVVSKLKSGARKTLLDLGIKEDDIVEFEVPKP